MGGYVLLEDGDGRFDCDDSDPAEQAWAWVDADQDGYVADLASQCVSSPLPPGYTDDALGNTDCDDQDSTVQVLRFRDDDGDGYGLPDEPPRCVSSADDEAPYTAVFSADCDDTDPQQNPAVPEQSGDSLDSNCDGAVDPTGCAGGDESEEGCSCVVGAPVEEVTSGCADSADLYVAYTIDCILEFRTVGFLLAVGNRGTVGYDGEVRLVASSASGEVVWEQPVMIQLVPGAFQEVGAPLLSGFGAIGVTLQADGDCDGGTARVDVYRSQIDLP